MPMLRSSGAQDVRLEGWQVLLAGWLAGLKSGSKNQGDCEYLNVVALALPCA